MPSVPQLSSLQREREAEPSPTHTSAKQPGLLQPKTTEANLPQECAEREKPDRYILPSSMKQPLHPLSLGRKQPELQLPLVPEPWEQRQSQHCSPHPCCSSVPRPAHSNSSSAFGLDNFSTLGFFAAVNDSCGLFFPFFSSSMCSATGC